MTYPDRPTRHLFIYFEKIEGNQPNLRHVLTVPLDIYFVAYLLHSQLCLHVFSSHCQLILEHPE
jgi:hypothetical protein